VAQGPLGSWLVEATEGDPTDLLKAHVTVSGELFEVQVPGRRKTYRLVMDAISGPFGTYPPLSATSEPEGPHEAPSEPLFSPEVQAELDAELAAL
jgi:hypothetical protein